MSLLKISNDTFLGKIELERLIQFLDEDGFRKFMRQRSNSFGFLRGGSLAFDNARVEKDSNDNTIKYKNIEAVDSDLNFLTKKAANLINVPSGGSWYWVKVSYSSNNYENGIVDISSDGQITGLDTSFVEVLRGVTTDYPSKIKFPDSLVNTGEYDILDVISDTSAVLQGTSFTAEIGAKFVVVGTFSPDAVPDPSDKDIFVYDSATVSLELETVSNTPPIFTKGKEFFAARVRSVGTDVEIQDKRSEYLYSTVDGDNFIAIDRSENPLIGVESVRFNSPKDPQSKNIVDISWSMRSSNWTFDSSVNRLTIISGNGGKFKDTDDFTNGDFDGWRVYFSNGKYSKIVQSSKTASQINLILDSLNPDDLALSSQQVLITPDVERVSIKCQPDFNTGETFIEKDFPVNTSVAQIELPVYDDIGSFYQIFYKNITINQYSEYATIPDDAVGYFDETSFDEFGQIEAPTNLKPYVDGEISLIEAEDSFFKRLSFLTTGDLFGLSEITLSNVSPVNNFVVGTDKKNALLVGSFSMTTNQFINLSSSGATDGNEFTLFFDSAINLGGFQFRIVQDFINTGSIGTVLLSINQDMLDKAASGLFFVKCVFDGTNWNVRPVTYVNEPDIDARLVSKTQPAWITPTVNTGWSTSNAFGYRPIRYRQNSLGQIEIDGFIANSTGSNPAFQLPAQLSPSAEIRFFGVRTATGSFNTIRINSIGEVSIISSIDATAGSSHIQVTFWTD